MMVGRQPDGGQHKPRVVYCVGTRATNNKLNGVVVAWDEVKAPYYQVVDCESEWNQGNHNPAHKVAGLPGGGRLIYFL
jgi:hypothetical protein